MYVSPHDIERRDTGADDEEEEEESVSKDASSRRSRRAASMQHQQRLKNRKKKTEPPTLFDSAKKKFLYPYSKRPGTPNLLPPIGTSRVDQVKEVLKSHRRKAVATMDMLGTEGAGKISGGAAKPHAPSLSSGGGSGTNGKRKNPQLQRNWREIQAAKKEGVSDLLTQ